MRTKSDIHRELCPVIAGFLPINGRNGGTFALLREIQIGNAWRRDWFC